MMNFKNKVTLFYLTAVIVFSSALFAQEKKKSLWQSLNTPAEKSNQSDDYYGEQILRYEDYVYKPYIKTVRLHDQSFELSQPILNLSSEEKLELSFDDLQADLKNYSYTIIHCNANWEPSDLMSQEYIDGFVDNNINDYSYSFNTLIKYTHYFVTFPNSSMRITKSGNYILKVFKNNDPNDLVITKRFVVYQNKVMVQARVYAASIIADRNYKQEIDFTVNHNGYLITNPYSDLKIVITQNNRWDNAIKGLKPRFVKDNELVYDYEDVNVFSGGNEYRFFDIKSIRYQSEKIYSIKTDSLANVITLFNDEKRTFKRFYSQADINGNYIVKIQEGRRSEVEADYCVVNFFMPTTDPFSDGNLYVFGALTNWNCTKENMMKYNEKRFGYECSLLLKQGFYNYEYAFVKDGTIEADNTVIEGMHYETENDYNIYIYHKQQGTFYDQLIGVKRVNSMKDF